MPDLAGARPALAPGEPAPLLLGHSAPHTLDRAGVESVAEALPLDRAARADRLGLRHLPQRGARVRDREKQLGVGRSAGGTRPPASAVVQTSAVVQSSHADPSLSFCWL